MTEAERKLNTDIKNAAIAPAAAAPPSVPPRVVRFCVVPHARAGEGPNFSQLGPVDVDAPNAAVEGWSLKIRGGAVFFVSPPGWRQGMPLTQLPGKGRVRIIEVPRQHVTFVFEADDDSIIDKLQRFDVPPIRRPVSPSEAEPVLDSKELGDP